MKNIIITLVSILVIIGAAMLGVIIYERNDSKETPTIIEKVAEEEIFDECTDEYEEIQNNVVVTDATEEKISPNAGITLKKYYAQCGHTTSQYLEVSEDLVNKTKSELQDVYKDWQIEKFSDTEIILEKEENGNCGEHYMVRDKNGKITIYEILADESEKEYEETEISTEYLTATDKNNLEKGICVNGKQNLNRLIEDFE